MEPSGHYDLTGRTPLAGEGCAIAKLQV